MCLFCSRLIENLFNSLFCGFRENFLRLDVFMQELSYEEITQQIAYDVPRLLSKRFLLFIYH